MEIFWLKEESLEDSENLPDPAVLAREIIESWMRANDASLPTSLLLIRAFLLGEAVRTM